MIHAGSHEQSNGGLCLFAAGVKDVLVIADGVLRRDQRVAPAVIHDQLAAVREEFPQVGIGRSDHTIIELVGQSNVGIKVQLSKVPGRVMEDEIFEVGCGDRRFGGRAGNKPSQFASRFQARRTCSRFADLGPA
jgi:hypothetical protein